MRVRHTENVSEQMAQLATLSSSCSLDNNQRHQLMMRGDDVVTNDNAIANKKIRIIYLKSIVSN